MVVSEVSKARQPPAYWQDEVPKTTHYQVTQTALVKSETPSGPPTMLCLCDIPKEESRQKFASSLTCLTWAVLSVSKMTLRAADNNTTIPLDPRHEKELVAVIQPQSQPLHSTLSSSQSSYGCPLARIMRCVCAPAAPGGGSHTYPDCHQYDCNWLTWCIKADVSVTSVDVTVGP